MYVFSVCVCTQVLHECTCMCLVSVLGYTGVV